MIKLLFALVTTAAHGATGISQDGEIIDNRRDLLIAEQSRHLCSSTDEYIKALTFLRTTKEFLIPEKSARLIAEKVARGCNGASERFVSILRLLKTVGLSDPGALQIALQFSTYTSDVQKNFSTIFTRAFIGEFFDYDYTTAVALAMELSKNYRGDANLVREDFIALTQFCKKSQTMDLPNRTCAEYAIKMARLSDLYPQGIREPFLTLYKKLRENREFGMDVKSALDVAYNVLKHGPKAPDNFLDGYSFAMKDSGLALGRNQALAFALRMAARSFEGEKPPAIPAVDYATE